MSRDEAMAEAARSTDLYSGMVASGAVATRAEAKVGMLGRDVRRHPRARAGA